MNCKSIFSILFFICANVYYFAQESYNTLVYEGNQEFSKKNYESSSSKYAEAIKKNDKDFSAHYNLGNAFYKRKLYDEAKAEYEKASQRATSVEDKAAALYNLGNAEMQKDNSEAAAENYKKALKQSPYNETIRKNYEIAMLREKEKQQQQQQKDQGGNSEKENKDSKGQDKGETPKSEGGKGKENKGEGQGENPDEKDNPGKLPKDLEKSLLNRIENKERETATRILNKNSYSLPQSNEKDW